MIASGTVKHAVWILALVALAAVAQQNSDKAATKDKEKNKASQTKSQPLFANRLGYKSSKTSKESTTLGFNGIDPSGKVDQQTLAKVPTADDQEKVSMMAANIPPPADLAAFLRAGGLKQK